MIGKKLSNGWKTPPDFSNDWKNFSPVFQRLEKIFAPPIPRPPSPARPVRPVPATPEKVFTDWRKRGFAFKGRT